ncbi:hypothetical protein QR680_006394 [Steinernema hermaphroditum]|uniref:Uncharacterized protein n=1 Tax=Steinernema hermaphroditum TaxID=289476 RepID=A0AA39HVE6_9BILA|nr:hypothetical protein QR680_006394 [Steinernema hermaphroditum]
MRYRMEGVEMDIGRAIRLLRFRPAHGINRKKTNRRRSLPKKVRFNMSKNVYHMYPQEAEWDEAQRMADGRTAYPKKGGEATKGKPEERRERRSYEKISSANRKCNSFSSSEEFNDE